MTQSVSHVTSSKAPTEAQNVEKSTKKTPVGISANKSTIQSVEEKKSNKTFFQKIKSCFSNIIQSIKNLFLSIYYKIFPSKKPVVIPKKSETELEIEKLKLQLDELKLKLEKLDSYSEELIFKEAETFLLAYTRLGNKIYKKSWNIFWKFYVDHFNKEYRYIIGKTEAKKDYKALIPFLKENYKERISKLEEEINKKLLTLTERKIKH